MTVTVPLQLRMSNTLALGPPVRLMFETPSSESLPPAESKSSVSLRVKSVSAAGMLSVLLPSPAMNWNNVEMVSYNCAASSPVSCCPALRLSSSALARTLPAVGRRTLDELTFSVSSPPPVLMMKLESAYAERPSLLTVIVSFLSPALRSSVKDGTSKKYSGLMLLAVSRIFCALAPFKMVSTAAGCVTASGGEISVM